MLQRAFLSLMLSLWFTILPGAAHASSFIGLSDAIHFYESIEDSGQWTTIPAGPSLRITDTHPHVPLLRKQLLLLGDLQPELQPTALENPEQFDSALHQALLKFQQRNGIEMDGVLGPQTRRLLNITPRDRIQQLAINTARQQAFGTPAVQHYIQVNIPEFKLRLYEQGQVILDMKTIIGRTSRQTPVFDTDINTLVVNPSWNVPRSIAFKDILPKWKKDNNYLSKHNLQIRSGWGPNSDIIPAELVDPSSMYQGAEYLRLFEPPSQKNTLGQIKFISKNRDSIYLHDTPAKNLFNRTQRAFSSGCVRLEKAQDLAHALLVLTNRPEYQQLDKMIETDETRNIQFPEPVPLYVTYWTAWLDEKGTLNFRDDLYKRDKSDFAELKSSENQINTAAQALYEQKQLVE
ncbi:L,D-transpeptidase family protein [Neptunomonas antarctica]|uniref:Putative peptidoglycan binding domain-containing protein n=1 Tax=Neptunomonas antarctica TaxID=619304 RepID=A0A1N7K7H7_9GAMM|nr:L,D-transpeptidase family protein [Neptunomonas antarctica]SIS57525.1 Putative peptidoglycan binding domain-containing protein [Neptunomonas antarctica]